VSRGASSNRATPQRRASHRSRAWEHTLGQEAKQEHACEASADREHRAGEVQARVSKETTKTTSEKTKSGEGHGAVNR